MDGGRGGMSQISARQSDRQRKCERREDVSARSHVKNTYTLYRVC